VNIRFDAYGEDDPDFKADLIMLMIDNIRELQEAAQECSEHKQGKVFSTAVHKTKSTINLLDDPELFLNIESIKEACNNWSDSSLKKVDSFRIFADILIRSLEHEAARLRGSR
jgi:hypothetical protein